MESETQDITAVVILTLEIAAVSPLSLRELFGIVEEFGLDARTTRRAQAKLLGMVARSESL